MKVCETVLHETVFKNKRNPRTGASWKFYQNKFINILCACKTFAGQKNIEKLKCTILLVYCIQEEECKKGCKSQKREFKSMQVLFL